MTGAGERSASPRELIAHYQRLRRMDGSGVAAQSAGDVVELPTAEAAAQPDIREHMSRTAAELHCIVKNYLDDRDDLHDIAQRIVNQGGPSLRALEDADCAAMADDEIVAQVETIVRTDGSRPSFLVREGVPDLDSSIVGGCGAALNDQPSVLQDALACVGRINCPNSPVGFWGTGYLIGERLVLTKRHVLQKLAVQDPASGDWTTIPEASIDFGHEFGARASLDRRAVEGVIFAGSQAIATSGKIDHRKLDLALLRIAPPAATRASPVLKFDGAPDWGNSGRKIFIVGYPADPGFSEATPPSLLEAHFKSTLGCKRIAPGVVSTTVGDLADSPRHWSVGHDATTLGGNSGSAVLIIGKASASVGLHYGGRWSEPRENWCHVLGCVLDETDGRSPKTLREHLAENHVTVEVPACGGV